MRSTRARCRRHASLQANGIDGDPRDWIDYGNRVMAAEIDSIPPEHTGIDPPNVTMAINEDGTYRVDILWGGHATEYPSEEYPEDVAFQRLVEWGFRGNFAMRWEGGHVATYKRIPWPDISGIVEPLGEGQTHYNTRGPTPGALQGDDFHIVDGYPIVPECLDRRPKPAMAEAA